MRKSAVSRSHLPEESIGREIGSCEADHMIKGLQHSSCCRRRLGPRLICSRTAAHTSSKKIPGQRTWSSGLLSRMGLKDRVFVCKVSSSEMTLMILTLGYNSFKKTDGQIWQQTNVRTCIIICLSWRLWNQTLLWCRDGRPYLDASLSSTRNPLIQLHPQWFMVPGDGWPWKLTGTGY